MVRNSGLHLKHLASFPHGRGDGPQAEVKDLNGFAFSPRAWGWSEAKKWFGGIDEVFPTGVGMVRPQRVQRSQDPSFPHGRGDGPSVLTWRTPPTVFSPRAWGWSARDTECGHRAGVFPTGVGMVRPRTKVTSGSSRFPHGRGDGPNCLDCNVLRWAFSPRAWGWSVLAGVVTNSLRVFPTGVGMVRIAP